MRESITAQHVDTLVSIAYQSTSPQLLPQVDVITVKYTCMSLSHLHHTLALTWHSVPESGCADTHQLPSCGTKACKVPGLPTYAGSRQLHV